MDGPPQGAPTHRKCACFFVPAARPRPGREPSYSPRGKAREQSADRRWCGSAAPRDPPRGQGRSPDRQRSPASNAGRRASRRPAAALLRSRATLSAIAFPRCRQPAPGRGIVVSPEWSPGSPGAGTPAGRGNRAAGLFRGPPRRVSRAHLHPVPPARSAFKMPPEGAPQRARWSDHNTGFMPGNKFPIIRLTPQASIARLCGQSGVRPMDVFSAPHFHTTKPPARS